MAEEEGLGVGNAMSKKDLEWLFGFALPAYNDSTTLSDPKLKTSSIAATLTSPALYHSESSLVSEGDSKASLGDKEIEHQRTLLAHAKSVLNSGSSSKGELGKWKGRRRASRMENDVSADRVRMAAEAWHLADTEAWKFVRAWGARAREERREWEGGERRFVGRGTWMDD